ncbi:hypothetical protein RhiJN_22521 [Ceratobasidium sp. AG-Ba]|nr:hypothetical protein RhiJN_22521 [Ceratobasidium sp. AG-Ba]
MKFMYAAVAMLAVPLTALAAPSASTPAIGTLGGMCAGFGGFKCKDKLCCFMNQNDLQVADAAGVCMDCTTPYQACKKP